MRAPGAVLAAVALAVAGLGLGTASGDPVPGEVAITGLQPHPPILIEGDDDFDPANNPLNGVRSGSGTAEDPYVISGWLILKSAPYGIRLVDTQAHVVIRDLLVENALERHSWIVECGLQDLDCNLRPVGIDIQRSSNVTVENVVVQHAVWGIRVDRSEHVVLESVRINQPNRSAQRTLVDEGLRLTRSEHVTVRNATIHEMFSPFRLIYTNHTRLVDSSILSGSYQNVDKGQLGPVENVTLARNLFQAARAYLAFLADNLTLAHNRFDEGAVRTSPYTPGDRYRSLDLCGNTFRGRVTAVDIHDAHTARLRGNDIQGTWYGFNVHDDANTARVPRHIEITRNRVHEVASDGFAEGFVVSGFPGTATLRNNSFEDNQDGHRIGTDVDARHNWWGHAGGPNATDLLNGGTLHPGPGEDLRVGAGSAFEPWLTSPPAVGPDAVDCGVPDGEPGAKRVPSFGPPPLEGVP